MMKIAAITAVALALAGQVAAWGQLGHQAVGYIAMEFLAPNALAFVEETVASSFNHSLGPAAVWADDVKHKKGFTFTAPFHFVDAEDDPLGGACSVDESRDCGSKGCILTAIANYTQRVQDTSLDATQVQQALYFIDHFLGDIGQPLHVEAFEVGGNDIHATCRGSTHWNLHSVWDTGMIEELVKGTYDDDVQQWASALVNEIKTGSYQADSANWISCSSTTQTLAMRYTIENDVQAILEAHTSPTNTITTLACPLVWAQESNAYDCRSVFDFQSGDDLCSPPYYTTNIEVINEQIAKQGYRLAAWLNVIFDGATNLP